MSEGAERPSAERQRVGDVHWEGDRRQREKLSAGLGPGPKSPSHNISPTQGHAGWSLAERQRGGRFCWLVAVRLLSTNQQPPGGRNDLAIFN